MDYKIIEANNGIRIKDMKDFEPKHIFECGQAFRWYKENDGSYTTINRGKVLNIKREGKDIVFTNTNEEDFHDIWYDYFDLGRDYGAIKEELSKDPVLREAIEFGWGIRVLKQNPFEMIISFIISANNQIPRIKKSIELISKRCGEKISNPYPYGNDANIPDDNSREYYKFALPNTLARENPDDLEQSCKVGYRAKYIVNTSRMIHNGEIDIHSLYKYPTKEAKEILMKFPGVGPKVSDCILLFGFNRDDVFPVDVWIKRVMEHFYIDSDMKLNDINEYANDRFGGLAGYAQQYLFYYARELGIGKKNTKI